MTKTNKKAATTTTATKRGRGRPTLTFKLPSKGSFTVKTILGRLSNSKNKPTLVTIHNHIKAALAAGTIQRNGVKPSTGRGRPVMVFKAVA